MPRPRRGRGVALPFAQARATDAELVTRVAEDYILQWPRRWADNLIARDTGDDWPGEKDDTKHANFIWGDDAFMGLTVPARLARAGLGNVSRYKEFAAYNSQLFASHLQDPADGVSPAPPYNTTASRRSVSVLAAAPPSNTVLAHALLGGAVSGVGFALRTRTRTQRCVGC